MSVIKCKMCGGDLVPIQGSTICECEYCGTRQTVPSADNEKKLTLFARAGRLLRACEFDKAAGIYESIAADFPQEAEAYWCMVLCKYGIEYVDDPATGRKIPTCHRSSFDCVLDDQNFEQACENTDAAARRYYRDEARQIEELRQAILAVSGLEEPYDVFICYKETDEHGQRTLDSVIAQDIYNELTDRGYRVFFSRISLEDKLGTEYEPYIFAALNSAKVMLAVGTDFEYFNAVWVKNEWSRFLKLIEKGEKKTLIPVFKNMDAYDMPREFSKLTALNMNKLGAMQDLVHGVEKIVGKKKEEPVQQVIVQQGGGPNVNAMLERGRQALEDGEWMKADGFFDQALNMDAKCAEAFLGKFCAREQKVNLGAVLGKKAEEAKRRVRAENLELPADEERENEIVRRYLIPGFLEEKEIREKIAFPREYPSEVPSAARVAEEENQSLKNDRLLSRAFSFAAPELRRKIEEETRRFRSQLSSVRERAAAREEESRDQIRKRYTEFLDDLEEMLAQRRHSAEQLRDEAYGDCVRRMESCGSILDYEKLAAELDRFEGFRDCGSLSAECRSAAERLHSRISALEQQAETIQKARERQAREDQATREREYGEYMARYPQLKALPDVEKELAETEKKLQQIGNEWVGNTVSNVKDSVMDTSKKAFLIAGIVVMAACMVFSVWLLIYEISEGMRVDVLFIVLFLIGPPFLIWKLVGLLKECKGSSIKKGNDVNAKLQTEKRAKELRERLDELRAIPAFVCSVDQRGPIEDGLEQARYELASLQLEKGGTPEDLKAAAKLFESLGAYRDSRQKLEKCRTLSA